MNWSKRYMVYNYLVLPATKETRMLFDKKGHAEKPVKTSRVTILTDVITVANLAQVMDLADS
jgi:hypothetical protein